MLIHTTSYIILKYTCHKQAEDSLSGRSEERQGLRFRIKPENPNPRRVDLHCARHHPADLGGSGLQPTWRPCSVRSDALCS